MKKHFYKRLLTIIIAFIAIFFFAAFLIRLSEGDVMEKVFRIIFTMFFSVVVAVFGLILDSIILYVKKERDKAKASLFVLIILLLTTFLVITITITFS